MNNPWRSGRRQWCYQLMSFLWPDEVMQLWRRRIVVHISVAVNKSNEKNYHYLTIKGVQALDSICQKALLQ